MPERMPMHMPKSLYVCTHYEAIVHYIFREDRNILVSRNPGTGISQCAVYPCIVLFKNNGVQIASNYI